MSLPAAITGLVDTHVHLLAGLDDGPRTWEESLDMCRQAVDEGISCAVAMTHQSERWQVSVDSIRQGTESLRQLLTNHSVPLQVVPSAEVMATPNLVSDWVNGRLMSMGDQRKFLLVEMPNGIYVDLRSVVRELSREGVRVVLAHPERHPELLTDSGRLDELLDLGCLVQVSTGSVTEPRDPASLKAIRRWFVAGRAHLLGTDAHSPRRRRPKMREAIRVVRDWVGDDRADAIGRRNGLAILTGKEPEISPVRRARWWSFGRALSTTAR